MEFCWLKSGGLTVRFLPYLSLSTSKRIELRGDYTVYAFVPSDASMLSAMAYCPGERGEDFVNGRFERILLSEDFYMLKIMDTYFQTSCVFCGSRGLAMCGCPLPMRRRCLGSESQMIGYKVREGKTCWEELVMAKRISANHGAMVFNVTKSPHSGLARVMVSGIFPYDVTVQMNVETNECLQKHLRLTGQSVNVRRTVLMPFSLKDSGNRQMMPQPSSVEDVAAPTASSSVHSGKLILSRNELVSLIPNTRKHAPVQGASAHTADSLSNVIESNKSELSWNVDTVIDSTNIPDNTLSAVLEEVLSDENCRIGSSRRYVELKNRSQFQAQPKLYACPECGMLIKNKSYNLKRHIKAVHQKERKFGCTVPNCGQRFQTKANLKRHISTVHKHQQTVQQKDQHVE